MNVPDWVKPAAFGVAGGAVGAMVIGFVWGGWVTGGTAAKMQEASAESAIVEAFTPLCVAKAQKEPDQLASLKEASRWTRDNFVIDAGWVDTVTQKHQTAVARNCASTLVEGMKTG